MKLDKETRFLISLIQHGHWASVWMNSYGQTEAGCHYRGGWELIESSLVKLTINDELTVEKTDMMIQVPAPCDMDKNRIIDVSVYRVKPERTGFEYMVMPDPDYLTFGEDKKAWEAYCKAKSWVSENQDNLAYQQFLLRGK